MHANRTLAVSLLAAALLIAGCNDLLDVENPNAVTDADIRNNRAAEAWANSSLFALQAGWDGAVHAYSYLSDEITFGGTYSWWNDLDAGDLENLESEAIRLGYINLAAGSWMTREALFVLDSLNDAGVLTDSVQLARVHFYHAFMLTLIANFMDDFAFSNRAEPGPAVGPANMDSLYDVAVQLSTAALELPIGDALRRDLLAVRAKAHFERAIWDRLGTLPIDVNGGGLVASAEAVQDAQDALAVDASDWRYVFEFNEGQNGSITACDAHGGCFPTLGRMGDRYADFGEDLVPDGAALIDPIDGVPDPWLDRFIREDLANAGGYRYMDLTAFSARELFLIVAEDALARGDTTAFADAINNVRGLESLTSWSPASGVPARDMLIHTRMATLFLQGHRVHDLYRFELQADNWIPTSTAVQLPGTLFPIPQSEIDVNCHLNPAEECG
jgi:hypothetical protein